MPHLPPHPGSTIVLLYATSGQLPQQVSKQSKTILVTLV